MLSGQTVVVTGCAGFIGSARRGSAPFDRATRWSASTISRPASADSSKALCGIPGFASGKRTSLMSMPWEEPLAGGELVIHLAGTPTFGSGQSTPARTSSRIRSPTLNVLEAMRANGCRESRSPRRVQSMVRLR